MSISPYHHCVPFCVFVFVWEITCPTLYTLEFAVAQGMAAVRHERKENNDFGFKFVVLGDGIGSLVQKEQIFLGCYLGEFNNPYFSGASQLFAQYPDAFMQNADGEVIKVEGNLVLAVDSPALYKINKNFIQEVCVALKDNSFLKFWAIGAEESWPDFFGTSDMGDFRPASIRHFHSFLNLKNWQVKTAKNLITEKSNNPTKLAWYQYREQAMADRAACYLTQFLEKSR